MIKKNIAIRETINVIVEYETIVLAPITPPVTTLFFIAPVAPRIISPADAKNTEVKNVNKIPIIIV